MVKRKLHIKDLFSCESYDNTHIKITFLGIKIKIPKPEYYKLKKQSPFYKYKKENYDITTLPPATGKLREIQLANLVLLKELDYVCRNNNLSYWLDGGTLLGAVRHRGYIPWDDDIDVGMLSYDYEKLIDIFNKNTRDKNIFADYYKDERKPDICIIKIQHKKCPHLFVDVFPFYVYGKAIDKEEQIKRTKNIKSIRHEFTSTVNENASIKALNLVYKTAMGEIILANDIPQNLEETDLVWGIQFDHRWKNWFTNYNVVFPLKPIEFEGYEYLGMNNPDAFLSRVYGSYMNYPKRITFGHSAFKKFEKNEYEIIKTLSKSYK